MTDHAHAWVPIPLEVARYSCACGEQAWRHPRGRLIVVQKGSRRRFVPRSEVVYPGGSRRRPTLDELERRDADMWRPRWMERR